MKKNVVSPKQMIVKLVVIFVWSLFVVACAPNHANKRKLGYGIQSFIPRYDDGRLTYSYTQLQKKSQLLGLDSIQNGSPNIQLRFWFSCTIKDYYKLIILTERENKWEANIIEYAAISHTRDSIELIRGPVRAVKQGFKLRNLINKLTALGVDTLIWQLYQVCKPQPLTVNFFWLKLLIPTLTG